MRGVTDDGRELRGRARRSLISRGYWLTTHCGNGERCRCGYGEHRTLAQEQRRGGLER